MARHFNPSIAQWLRRIFNFKVGSMITSDVGEILVPVIPILPVVNIVRNALRTASGTSTIFGTPLDKDFYLTGIFIAYQGNATSDSTVISVDVTLDGFARSFDFGKLSVTATQFNQWIQFDTPIKLDKGTNVNLVLAFTLGAEVSSATITGYTVESVSSSTQ